MNEREIRTTICHYCKMDVDENWIEHHQCEEKERKDERDTLLLSAKMAILIRLQDISKLHIPEGNALKSEIYHAVDDAFKEVK
jgi:hypothetical protein